MTRRHAGAEATHADEPHSGGLANRLNWLRAGVLGANDGIVSVAAIAVGVAGATPQLGPILTASVAGLVGGAISMALGEYVSVSSQRDSERALIAKEKHELATMPIQELAELTQLYQDKGLSPQTARQVAEELTAKDALAAHLEAELNIDQDDIVSPWRAAYTSAVVLPHRRRAARVSHDHLSGLDANPCHLCRRSHRSGHHRSDRRIPRWQSLTEANRSGVGRRRARARGDLPHWSSSWHHDAGLKLLAPSIRR